MPTGLTKLQKQLLSLIKQIESETNVLQGRSTFGG
jgi:hypothetical protein